MKEFIKMCLLSPTQRDGLGVEGEFENNFQEHSPLKKESQ